MEATTKPRTNSSQTRRFDEVNQNRKVWKIMIRREIQQVEEQYLRKEPLTFEIGDTVDVHQRILEGDKERIQIFSGVVIARRGGGTREKFTVRRIVSGEGVERTFPYHSPK